MLFNRSVLHDMAKKIKKTILSNGVVLLQDITFFFFFFKLISLFIFQLQIMHNYMIGMAFSIIFHCSPVHHSPVHISVV